VAVDALCPDFKNAASTIGVATHSFRRQTRGGETADIRNHLPDLIGAELSEGRHCGASDSGANVLENLAVGIAMRQNSATQGWSTVASASFASMASLACRIVCLAAGVTRIRIAGERIFLRLGNVLLRQEARERPQETCEQATGAESG
jgi:hypothetical protein